jgi:hypothetical protein
MTWLEESRPDNNRENASANTVASTDAVAAASNLWLRAVKATRNVHKLTDRVASNPVVSAGWAIIPAHPPDGAFSAPSPTSRPESAEPHGPHESSAALVRRIMCEPGG